MVHLDVRLRDLSHRRMLHHLEGRQKPFRSLQDLIQRALAEVHQGNALDPNRTPTHPNRPKSEVVHSIDP
jgi:hypothetical protein